MKWISESEMAQLSSKDRRTVSERVQHLKCMDGSHGAKLYKSDEALPAVFMVESSSGSLEDARTRLVNEQADLAKSRNAVLRKEWIPFDAVQVIWSDSMVKAMSIFKATKGQLLTVEKINEILAQLRGEEAAVRKLADVAAPSEIPPPGAVNLCRDDDRRPYDSNDPSTWPGHYRDKFGILIDPTWTGGRSVPAQFRGQARAAGVPFDENTGMLNGPWPSPQAAQKPSAAPQQAPRARRSAQS